MAPNGTENGNLTRNQKRVIPHLLTHRNIADAASACGLGERTVKRWLVDDESFQAALRRAEGQAIDAATRQLVALADMAVTVLHLIMVKKDATDAVRVRAALGALDHLVRIRELRNIEQRLARLEEIVNGQR